MQKGQSKLPKRIWKKENGFILSPSYLLRNLKEEAEGGDPDYVHLYKF